MAPKKPRAAAITKAPALIDHPSRKSHNKKYKYHNQRTNETEHAMNKIDQPLAQLLFLMYALKL